MAGFLHKLPPFRGRSLWIDSDCCSGLFFASADRNSATRFCNHGKDGRDAFLPVPAHTWSGRCHRAWDFEETEICLRRSCYSWQSSACRMEYRFLNVNDHSGDRPLPSRKSNRRVIQKGKNG